MLPTSASMTSAPPLAPVVPRSPLSVLGCLTGKRLFLTGGTGFVGKVILEKLLRSCPALDTVYVLVRPRKGSSADARMKAEIVESEIFNRLKSEIGVDAFHSRAQSKLRAMAGELTQERIGLSAEDVRTLQTEVDYVIHCAAIVDFNERIDRAVELNVIGSLRLMSLVQPSTRIAAFVHVSTCYVNSNRRGWIDERLYDLGFNPREMLERIRSLKQTELEKITGTGLLADWPNTYTFTKAMTEHLLVESRGRVPLAIVRPSIVGGSAKEPVPGWVDVISAAGAVYLSAGVGVLKVLPGSANHIADLVPVDYVTNAILTAIPAIANQDRYVIFHAATSSENPMYWGNAVDNVVRYFQRHPPEKRLGPPNFQMIENPQWYQLQFFLNYSIPSALLTSLSTAPFAPKSYRTKAAQFERIVFRARVIVEAFRHFVENEWVFNNRATRAIGQSLSDEERRMFPLDLTDFHWDNYNLNFAHGLLKFVLKTDLNPIPIDSSRSINLNQIPWTPSKKNEKNIFQMLSPIAPQLNRAHELWSHRPVYPKPRAQQAMIELVVSSQLVQQAIKAENEREAALAKTSKRPRSQSQSSSLSAKSVGEMRARSIMSKMFSDMNDKVLAPVGYAFQNLWSRMYDAISVEASGLDKARAAAAKGPIIFIPTHRSYVDFLVVSYVCYQCHLPLPHIAAGEDFLGILLVRWLFRHSGAFFIKRQIDSNNDPLYASIFAAYLQQLLIDGQSIEFFIEGTRSRSGKVLHPKQGLLSILTETVLDGKLKDASIIPISINYEQTMEGELYSSELLGEAKIRESLKSLIKSASVIGSKFGDIQVCFSDPISIADYTRDAVNTFANHRTEIDTNISRARAQTNDRHQPLTTIPQSWDPVTNKNDRKYLNYLLSYNIVYELTYGSCVMPTSIVASFILMYRQGISHTQLVNSVDWIRRELTVRSAKTYGIDGEEKTVLVDRALAHLNGLIIQRRSDVYEPNIAARHQYKNMLVLGHYRNKLVHHFFREGLFACALYSFGTEASTGVRQTELEKEVKFLYALLHREFIVKPNPDMPEDFDRTLELMIARKILARHSDNQLVEVANTGEAFYSFLCNLLWPFIDSYYVAVLTLFSLQSNRVVDEATLLNRTQMLATTLYHESMLSFYESCSMDTLRNAFTVLTQWQVIAKTKSASGVCVTLVGDYQTESGLQSLLARLDRGRKQPPVRKNAIRRNLIADIPILAKL